MRVLITNCVTLNGGDASIALGVLEQVREVFGDDVQVAFADSHPAIAARYYPELEYRPVIHRRLRTMRGITRGRLGMMIRELHIARMLVAARWPRCRWLLRPGERSELEAYDSFDVIISTGGTYLVEHYPLWPRLAELRLAVALGKPLIMYTHSLGPFSSRYHTRQVRFIAKRARAIFLRDQRSLQHLVDIGADISAASVVPDVAFALAAPAGGSRTGAVRKAVVSVRRWGSEESMDRYRGAVAQTISALVTAGFHVVLASSCQGIPEYVDDSQTSERIADTLSDDVRQAVTVDRSQRGPQELMTLLAEADIALCTRMHMAILSLNVGTPVVAIAYEFKTRELFESLGIAARVVDFETVTGDQLCRAVMDAIADPTLPPEVEDMKAGARATAGLLRRALEPSAA